MNSSSSLSFAFRLGTFFLFLFGLLTCNKLFITFTATWCETSIVAMSAKNLIGTKTERFLIQIFFAFATNKTSLMPMTLIEGKILSKKKKIKTNERKRESEKVNWSQSERLSRFCYKPWNRHRSVFDIHHKHSHSFVRNKEHNMAVHLVDKHFLVVVVVVVDLFDQFFSIFHPDFYFVSLVLVVAVGVWSVADPIVIDQSKHNDHFEVISDNRCNWNVPYASTGHWMQTTKWKRRVAIVMMKANYH